MGGSGGSSGWSQGTIPEDKLPLTHTLKSWQTFFSPLKPRPLLLRKTVLKVFTSTSVLVFPVFIKWSPSAFVAAVHGT